MNGVDEPQQRGILPDAAATLPVSSQMEITFRDGRTVQGTVGFTQNATRAECSDGATILLFTPWGPVDTATSAVAPIQSKATAARPVQMLLF